jgi:hypothetical protein
LQDPPKFSQIGIFGFKTNHLATLIRNGAKTWSGLTGLDYPAKTREFFCANQLLTTHLKDSEVGSKVRGKLLHLAN